MAVRLKVEQSIAKVSNMIGLSFLWDKRKLDNGEWERGAIDDEIILIDGCFVTRNFLRGCRRGSVC